MIARRKSSRGAEDANQVQQRFDRNEGFGKDIYTRILALRIISRDQLPDAVFVLLVAARQQSGLIRQSIKERTNHSFDLDSAADGDLATYLAEQVTNAVRDHKTRAPTFLDLLADRSHDVHFTDDQHDAISMIAALVREQLLEGILEGLRLAGLLNEPSKHRQ